MATSSQSWKPVSKRTTILSDGSILRRTLTKRDRHGYELTTPAPNNQVRDIELFTRRPRPIRKAKLIEMVVRTPKGPEEYGSKSDFQSVGNDVVKNVLKTFQKMYPKMKGIFGKRVHKPMTSTGHHQITLFKFKDIKDR